MLFQFANWLYLSLHIFHIYLKGCTWISSILQIVHLLLLFFLEILAINSNYLIFFNVVAFCLPFTHSLQCEERVFRSILLVHSLLYSFLFTFEEELIYSVTHSYLVWRSSFPPLPPEKSLAQFLFTILKKELLNRQVLLYFLLPS